MDEMVFCRDTGTKEDEDEVDALDMGGMTAAAMVAGRISKRGG